MLAFPAPRLPPFAADDVSLLLLYLMIVPPVVFVVVAVAVAVAGAVAASAIAAAAVVIVHTPLLLHVLAGRGVDGDGADAAFVFVIHASLVSRCRWPSP